MSSHPVEIYLISLVRFCRYHLVIVHCHHILSTSNFLFEPSFSFLQLFSVFHDQTQIPDAPASTRDRSQVQMPPMRSSISSSWISCKVNITRTNSRAMELYGNSRRWRLYLPKQTAVVFMFYPHKLWSTNVVLLRYTCLTVGPIQLFISIC